LGKSSHGIYFKKQFGQNFLRDPQVVHRIVNSVTLSEQSTVLEIGSGDGFLTRAILEKNIKKLIAYEIDLEWAGFLKNQIKDPRFSIIIQDILTVNWPDLKKNGPLVLLANLPYNITFPLLYLLQQHRDFFVEGTIMIQEEVAQKLVKSGGRDYGFVSLFFQYHFEWTLLEKVLPSAFEPEPNVFSRLLHFKPRTQVAPIPDEEKFWSFVKICFKQPRRTLRNNLGGTIYQNCAIDEKSLEQRAQQMTINDLLAIWNKLIAI
jgi:16S rRNA (adenine1518-N6/adenine1519-N6)-dimethyltransferase